MHPDLQLRTMLRDIAGDPAPSSTQRDAALGRLRAEYADGAEIRRRWVTRAAAIATLIAVIVGLALILPTTAPRVDATLEELARAARNVPATELPEGSYVYVRSETANLRFEPTGLAPPDELVAYTLPLTADEWWQGNTVLSTVTTGEPVFVDDESRRLYETAGLRAIDGVGTTRTDAFTDIDGIDIAAWSTDSEELRDQLSAAVAQRTDRLPFDAQALLVVEELLAPQLLAPPELRAALVEYVGTLDVDTAALADGSVDVALEFADPDRGMLRKTLRFDRAGYLVGHRLVVLTPVSGFPARPGAVIEDRTQAPPAIVPAAGEFP